MLVGGGIGRIDGVVFVVAGGIHGRAHAVGSCFIDLGGLLLVGQLAVMRPGGHVEIHVAGGLAIRIRDHIAMAVVENALNQIDHVRHMAGGAGLHGGRQHAKRVVRLGEFALIVVGAGPPALTGGCGLVENLVVDVGHIAHERDLVSELQEPAAHDVERYGGTDMADMRGRLHGGATHVDADLARLERHEMTDLMRCGVIQIQAVGDLGYMHRRQARRHNGSVEILRFLAVSHSH